MRQIFCFALAGTALIAGFCDQAQARTATEIRYETSVCYGSCPHFVVSVQPNGRGTFNGIRFTKVTGLRNFRATPAQVKAFTNALEPYRYVAGGQPQVGACKLVHTDDITVTVSWGAKRKLSHYFGCDGPEFEGIEAALRAAPKFLPIADMIGDPSQWRRSMKPGK